MIDDKTEAVLRSIFHPALSETEPKHLSSLQSQPEFDDLVALATQLAADAPEEALQQVLVERPKLLLRSLPSAGDMNLAFITKPAIGNSFRADFAVLSSGQGGCDIELVELERAIDPLFTRDGTPARRLQGAIGQVHDWHQWIVANQSTFIRDTVSRATSIPVFPRRSENGSFALKDSEYLEASWRGFGGFENAQMRYIIVIGRWGLLSREHRERLIFLNQQNNSLYTIRTYDQLLRKAYEGPDMFY